MVKNPPVRHLGSIPGSERSPGGGQGNRLQNSCLENPYGQRSLVGYSPWVLSVGFSRQEYWSGLSFPTPEDLPDARIEPMFLASPAFAGRFFTTVPPDPLIPFFHEIFCEHSCPLIFSTSESLPSTLKHTHPLLIVISKVAPVNRLLRKVERTADHNIRKTLKWKQHPYSSFFLDTPQFCLEAATA